MRAFTSCRYVLLMTMASLACGQKDRFANGPLLHYPPPASVLPLLNTRPIGTGHLTRGYPSLEQQILIYQGGLPGQQPFLLQPGGAPPGNFLIPQPQPGFVLRDVPPPPQRGAFYPPGAPQQPRPAFTPPINKDAEEIPTNPAAVPPFRSQDLRPVKLETFDETPEYEEQTPSSKTKPPSTSGLRPGQRFFILNGQPLFANYPLQFLNQQPAFGPSVFGHQQQQQQQQQPGPFYFQPLEFGKVPPPSSYAPQVPIDDLLLRNGITGEIADVKSSNGNKDAIDKGSLRYSLPVAADGKAEEKIEPIVVADDSTKTDADDDSVVIDAKFDDKENEAEVVESNGKSEPSTAQVQPAAIALAGPGGVASAGPRGTALVGEGGLAVSSPKATAVAGPRDEDKKKKQQKGEKPK